MRFVLLDRWAWVPEIQREWFDLGQMTITFPGFLALCGVTAEQASEAIVKAFRS